MSDQDSNVRQLSMYQENMQQLVNQKQQFQTQLIEINSALSEVANTKSAYRIMGNIMVKTDRKSLEKELEEKKETVELRIKSLEKQENLLKDKSKKLQKEVMEKMKK